MEHHRLTEAEIDKMLIDSFASLGRVEMGRFSDAGAFFSTKKHGEAGARFAAKYCNKTYRTQHDFVFSADKPQVAQHLPTVLFRMQGTVICKATDYWAFLSTPRTNVSILCIELSNVLGNSATLHATSYARDGRWLTGHYAERLMQDFNVLLQAEFGGAMLTPFPRNKP